MTTLKQTPSQTVGPYFAYGLCPEQYNFDLKSLFTNELADREAAGEHITLIGQVFDGDGAAIGDAMIEVQQVDSEGRYPQSREDVAKTGFRGFARFGTGTDPQKRFIFETVKPGRASPDEAPHLNVIVTMRGMLLHTFTRVYFDDETAANDKDPVLASVPAERRATLVAKREAKGGKAVYRFDIHMQGPKETVFFDL
ncbi:protocatechuate 3,4-dioxygenase subunit alpha [Paraburkholderia caribensis]|jgi:protocatechuate 3,4-dioxygenase alpha subunit|uniref:Protocatechuate 3,4-dioxygenase subunit alpha n=1 Tax=Paraburkholderia caribensis TaxID=75105 RepID=A0A9Q6WN59_9BURK|nr:protocatechuate 3,4-dioxygenase subunit alpha [Paraburkholderia caribensis]ALP65606.1 protocatechuate 3,4-dioxygenase subunit alpha [Paraburkholderia caribensis]AMV46485.1 protocatechuate 3,4-dioxygenase subunit alpha [Paraburkholderia caribensis]AUT55471.1 protocatechuate 3,4-dioxygenase subunit alpha [Paraburkholderia caribensis]MCO4879778.1 protocatechuate 3,4-dioxygenase subunit alpha [Paraburkholderia caribensis]PTB24696.1 protocatechuate 3,4-dioxygenase subunit alpha [Paraburkholderia